MNKKNIIIATIKSWNINNFDKLKEKDNQFNWILLTENEQLTPQYLKEIQPVYVFFPHWSWIIPKNIYSNYNCVVFHMTDLPFGRGGSPLQNLISRGIYNTRISAIKVVQGLDAGDIYMKQDLDLSNGSASEIFRTASDKIFTMILKIAHNNPTPTKQEGEIVEFMRRTPDESLIPKDADISKVYDWIRMLDGEGYPNAFLETDKLKFKFFSAQIDDNKKFIEAKVKIERR